jgi:hypothetical protein
MVDKSSSFTKAISEFVGAGYAKVATDSLLTSENQIITLLS